MNVVYFLDPLEKYVLARIVKKGGKVLSACKFAHIHQAMDVVVPNKSVERVRTAMEGGGLTVEVEEVDDFLYDYQAVVGTRV